MSLVQSPPLAPAKASQITARALMLGERLDTAMLERSDVISTAPLAFRADEFELILGGGVFPQLQVSSRRRAADEILQRRQAVTCESPEQAVAPPMPTAAPVGAPAPT